MRVLLQEVAGAEGIWSARGHCDPVHLGRKFRVERSNSLLLLTPAAFVLMPGKEPYLLALPAGSRQAQNRPGRRLGGSVVRPAQAQRPTKLVWPGEGQCAQAGLPALGEHEGRDWVGRRLQWRCVVAAV